MCNDLKLLSIKLNIKVELKIFDAKKWIVKRTGYVISLQLFQGIV